MCFDLQGSGVGGGGGGGHFSLCPQLSFHLLLLMTMRWTRGTIDRRLGPQGALCLHELMLLALGVTGGPDVNTLLCKCPLQTWRCAGSFANCHSSVQMTDTNATKPSGLKTLYSALVCLLISVGRPDVTFAVDWALNNNYLSIFANVAPL